MADISKYIFFEDRIPEVDSQLINSGDDSDIALLESILKDWGFSGIGNSSYLSVWSIVDDGRSGLSLEWVGEFFIKPKNNFTHAIKFKNYNRSEYQLCTDIISDGSIYLNDAAKELGNNRYSVYISELGFGMNINQAYRWNDEKSILNQLLLPIQAVSAIGENDLNKQESITSDLVDIYGDTVEYKYLNQIAAYQTIPRYYLGNKLKSFKGISFNHNVENSKDTMVDSNGQFIFDDEVTYRGGSGKKVQYWSFYPEMYPIVLFNNTIDLDANSSSGSYSELKTHNFKYENNIITIDNRSIKLQPNDVVVFYVRKQGEWTPDSSLSYPGNWKPTSSSEIEIGDFSTTGVLEMPSIGMYQYNQTNTESFSFTADKSYIENFTKHSLINGSPYNKIIKTQAKTQYKLPPLVGGDYGQSSMWDLLGRKGTFFSIGSYTYEKTYWNGYQDISKTKDATWELTASINNFQYVYSGVDFSPTFFAQETNIDVSDPVWASADSNETSFRENRQQAEFYMLGQWVVGFFPQKIGFFQNIEDIVAESDTLLSKESKYLKIDDMSYKYRNYSWINTFNGFNETDYSLDMTIGYQQRIQAETFALAIVVWRNGNSLNINNGVLYECSVNNDVFYATFYNGSKVNIIVKPGSDAGYFDENTWKTIPPNSLDTISVSNLSEVLHWTSNPFIEYYDPIKDKNVKIFLKDY